MLPPLKTRIRNWFRSRIGPGLVYGIYRALHATWRVSFDECESFRTALAQRRPVVFAHWHGDELGLVFLFGRYRTATLASQSRDGALMSGFVERFGGTTVRGSSSKGAAAGLRALVQACRREGHNVSFAVDGPKGPLYSVKPGVFEFSRLLDAPVYTISVGASRAWVLRRSWNRALLPKPFARVHIRVVECLDPVTRDQDPRDADLAGRLASALHAQRAQAWQAMGSSVPAAMQGSAASVSPADSGPSR